MLPFFHEKENPLAGTTLWGVLDELGVLDGLDELDELDELDVLDVLDVLDELDVLEVLDELGILGILGVLDVLDVLDAPCVLDEISEPSPPTLPTSVIPGSEVLCGSSRPPELSCSPPPEPVESDELLLESRESDETEGSLCPRSPRNSSPPRHPDSVITAASSNAADLICTRLTAYFLISLENSSALPRSPSTLSLPVVYAATGSSLPSASLMKLDGSSVIAHERSMYSYGSTETTPFFTST